MHDTRDSVKLRYDGRYDWIPGENRQWTILTHWLDSAGADRFRSSFSLEGLTGLGIVPKQNDAK